MVTIPYYANSFTKLLQQVFIQDNCYARKLTFLTSYTSHENIIVQLVVSKKTIATFLHICPVSQTIKQKTKPTSTSVCVQS
jgi:hypothetical protein